MRLDLNADTKVYQPRGAEGQRRPGATALPGLGQSWLWPSRIPPWPGTLHLLGEGNFWQLPLILEGFGSVSTLITWSTHPGFSNKIPSLDWKDVLVIFKGIRCAENLSLLCCWLFPAARDGCFSWKAAESFVLLAALPSAQHKKHNTKI